MPIAIKDETDVAGETTAYGTSAHGPAAAQDGEVVRRLRAAGAVIIGKTSEPEAMMFPYTESLTFGATASPWDITRTPGAERLRGAVIGHRRGTLQKWCGHRPRR